jgi:hypothetical protein
MKFVTLAIGLSLLGAAASPSLADDTTGAPFWGCYAKSHNKQAGHSANGATWNDKTEQDARKFALASCTKQLENGDPPCRIVECAQNIPDEKAAMAKWRR